MYADSYLILFVELTNSMTATVLKKIKLNQPLDKAG